MLIKLGAKISKAWLQTPMAIEGAEQHEAEVVEEIQDQFAKFEGKSVILQLGITIGLITFTWELHQITTRQAKTIALPT